MNIAIYSRKSKYNDKSESTDSQINFCKIFAESKYPKEEITYHIYTDEGFSGGSTDRPQYKKMLADLKKKNIDIIIGYKIDRISRSFIDFANLQQILNKYGINIISASEGFDTSTPWGKSVLNILMVFAELERNNVSERIKDTMLHYARKGRWTGGLTPTGFKSDVLTYKDSSNQTKKMMILSPIKEETELVKIMYKKYYELKSLSSLNTWLIKNNFKTKKGNSFSPATIRDILRNPVYVNANSSIYEYFKNKNCEICGSKTDFNGKCGIIPYNRIDKKSMKERPPSEWIIALGKHKGIIESSLWIEVQKTLIKNSLIIPRKGTSEAGLFSGMIFCKKCGSLMRTKKGRLNKKTNKPEHYYLCALKEKSHKEKCGAENITETILYNLFFKYLENLFNNPLYSKIKLKKSDIKYKESITPSEITIKNLKSILDEKEKAINNLVFQLSQTSNLSSGKYISKQIEQLDKEITEINSELFKMQKTKTKGICKPKLNIIENSLKSISALTHIKNIKTKREILTSAISCLEWDGEKIYVHFADFQ